MQEKYLCGISEQDRCPPQALGTPYAFDLTGGVKKKNRLCENQTCRNFPSPSFQVSNMLTKDQNLLEIIVFIQTLVCLSTRHRQ